MQKMQNKRLIQRIWVSFLAMGLMLLVGCQAKPQGLTPDQIAALQEQGFKLTDNGWEFGLANKVLFDSDVKKLNSEGMQTVQRLAGYCQMWGLSICGLMVIPTPSGRMTIINNYPTSAP